VLLLVYLGFSWSLNRSSNPVYSVLRDVPDKFAPAQPPPPPKAIGLSVLLQPEIAQGWVSVTELADRAIVRLRGDNLFESGSASVNPQYQQVLARVAEALNSTPGTVVVSGHTDNRPILSLRFPSNWDLSKARADAVVALLSGGLANPARVRSEGRGDMEPIVNNDTPANRAINRRVDITLFNPVATPALIRPSK
jgi:type VI secretion system protein ImpK